MDKIKIMILNKNTNNSKKRIAFTLAEVLIVLLIIGVISSLVIPAIIQDVQNAELKTAYRKAYADASQALLMARTNNELIDVNGSDTKVLLNIQTFKNYFNATKSCTDSVIEGCWVDNCMGGDNDCFNNTPSEDQQGRGPGFIDNAGRSWAHYQIGSDWFLMLVDTNGAKVPNRLGRDRFPLYFYDANNLANAKAPIKVSPPQDIVGVDAIHCKFGKCYYTSWLK